jgi:hypothetical protein
MVRLAVRAVAGLAVLAFLAEGPGHAKADFIIYSNFGPGQTYEPGFYSVSGGGGGNFPNGFALAESFHPTVNSLFSSVALPLTLVPGFNGGNTNAFTVSLMSDAGGHPGTTLESFSITGVPLYPNSAIEKFTSKINTLLNAGTTYWIAVFPGAADTFGGWSIKSTGATGISKTGNDGVTWSAYTDTSAAFEVDGLKIVPEPASLTMLGIGTLSLLGFAWKRKHTA